MRGRDAPSPHPFIFPGLLGNLGIWASGFPSLRPCSDFWKLPTSLGAAASAPTPVACRGAPRGTSRAPCLAPLTNSLRRSLKPRPWEAQGGLGGGRCLGSQS